MLVDFLAEVVGASELSWKTTLTVSGVEVGVGLGFGVVVGLG
jgi:hypothetical protein